MSKWRWPAGSCRSDVALVPVAANQTVRHTRPWRRKDAYHVQRLARVTKADSHFIYPVTTTRCTDQCQCGYYRLSSPCAIHDKSGARQRCTRPTAAATLVSQRRCNSNEKVCGMSTIIDAKVLTARVGYEFTLDDLRLSMLCTNPVVQHIVDAFQFRAFGVTTPPPRLALFRMPFLLDWFSKRGSGSHQTIRKSYRFDFSTSNCSALSLI